MFATLKDKNAFLNAPEKRDQELIHKSESHLQSNEQTPATK